MSFRPLYKIRDWMPCVKYLDYDELIENPRSINELEKHDMVSVNNMSKHPDAIHLLEKEKDKIDLIDLSINPSACHMFEYYLKNGKCLLFPGVEFYYNNDISDNNYLSLAYILDNPNAILFIENNFGYIFEEKYKIQNEKEYSYKSWFIGCLCKNKNAIHLLDRPHLLKFIDIRNLSKNPNGYKMFEKYEFLRIKLLKDTNLHFDMCALNGESVIFLEKYGIDIINNGCKWVSLHYNSSDYALDILEKHKQYINWWALCLNTNPRAIQMLKSTNVENLNWKILSINPAAIEMIEDYVNQSKKNNRSLIVNNRLSLNNLTRNPEIFVFDSNAMKEQINTDIIDGLSFAEDLIKTAMSPKRMKYYLDNYDYDILGEEYLYDKTDLFS